MVADALEIVAVPKLASGKTPPDEDGASTIHSAELRPALFRRWLVLKLAPVVRFVSVNIKRLLLKATSALITLPGWIDMESVTGNFGYISYHAEYLG